MPAESWFAFLYGNNVIRSDSRPGGGTPDVKTRFDTTDVSPVPNTRDVIIVRRPGSQMIVCFSFPAGAMKRETLADTKAGCKINSAFFSCGSPHRLMSRLHSRGVSLSVGASQ